MRGFQDFLPAFVFHEERLRSQEEIKKNLDLREKVMTEKQMT